MSDPSELGVGILLIVFLIHVAIAAGIGVLIAKAKNQDTMTGILLGGFLGILGWIILLCLPSNPKSSTRRRGRSGTGRITGRTVGRTASSRPGSVRSYRDRR